MTNIKQEQIQDFQRGRGGGEGRSTSAEGDKLSSGVWEHVPPEIFENLCL